MANENYMRFITGVHFTKSMLRTLNGITFLFDPNWEAGVGDTPTFPVCFFHVKGQHEVMESEVSHKTMLFYNDNKSLSATSVTGGMTNVVADNIVIKPKVYKLDVIIPYSDLTLLTSSYVFQPEQLSGVVSLLKNGEEKKNNVAPYLTMATPYVEIIKTLLRQLMVADYSSISNFMSSVISTPDYNKNSLEAMWKNRSILKLKLWNGWKYKYVSIVSTDVSKEPTEDGVYEASITVQEMPIMTFRKTGIKTANWVNPILKVSGEAVKAVLNGKEGM